MGLDLVVEGCPRPGHEDEWRRLLQRSFDGEEPDEGEVERFQAIVIPSYARVGAPRVGEDAAADAWLTAAAKADSPEKADRLIEENRGYHVLALAECDGVPKYSNAGLYDGVDETSFRGAFLADCGDILSAALIEQAWTHKFPEEAIRYGEALLAAAETAKAQPAQAARKPGLLARFLGKRQEEKALSPDEQLDIVRSAGRWFLFWGERGHAIRAWF